MLNIYLINPYPVHPTSMNSTEPFHHFIVIHLLGVDKSKQDRNTAWNLDSQSRARECILKHIRVILWPIAPIDRVGNDRKDVRKADGAITSIIFHAAVSRPLFVNGITMRVPYCVAAGKLDGQLDNEREREREAHEVRGPYSWMYMNKYVAAPQPPHVTRDARAHRQAAYIRLAGVKVKPVFYWTRV